MPTTKPKPRLKPTDLAKIKAAFREVALLMKTSGIYLLHGLKDIFVVQQLLRGKAVPMERVRYERQLFDLAGSHDVGSFVQSYLYLRLIKKSGAIVNQIASVGSEGVWFIFHPNVIADCEFLIHVNSMDAKGTGMEASYHGLVIGEAEGRRGREPVDAYINALTMNIKGLIRSPSANNELLLGGGASIKHLVAIVGTKAQLEVVGNDLPSAAPATKEFNDQAKSNYKALLQSIALKAPKEDKLAPKHFYSGAADAVDAKERFIIERINAGRTSRGVPPIVKLEDVMFEREAEKSPLSVQEIIQTIKGRTEARQQATPQPLQVSV